MDSRSTDPVFVLCTGRSGSTLLRFILDAHPDLACPPETRLPWLATQLANAWSVLTDSPPQDNDAGPTEFAGPVIAGLRLSLSPMIDSYLAKRGKTRYCDKSLGGAAHADLLLRVWPEARFICLYRHPMDMISSGLDASPWGLVGYGFDNYAGGSANNVAALARYWADYTAAIVEAEDEFKERCLRVRYEDLVAEPDVEIKRIFDFLEVAPTVGIEQGSFGLDQQRYGPADYKIWSTTRVTAEFVGQGWELPVRMISDSLLERVNGLAAKLGYVQVTRDWGAGSRPVDLRVRDAVRPAGGSAPEALARPPDATSLIEQRVQAAMRRLADADWSPPGSKPTESVLLLASATGPGETDAWWRLDPGAGTMLAGTGYQAAAGTDWSITGSAQVWERLLTGAANLGAAFRRGELRYSARDGVDAGSPAADQRVALIAGLLGVSPLPAGPLPAGPLPAGVAGGAERHEDDQQERGPG
ncbi:MAG TPA: sulfotransferase [Streptosporangiaceae bacterium]